MDVQFNINKLGDLDEAIRVSEKVFNPTPDEQITYHSKDDWLKKIKNNGLLITALVKDELVGFSICYSKEDKLHIWNVGIIENYRRFGIWKQIYLEIEKHAKNNNFKYLTINTYKSKFPGMYNFCLKNGFKEYKTEDKKSFFIKNI